jgi:hypothetical protein
MGLLGFENYDDFKEAHYKWVDSEIQTNNSDKENKWTQSIAVGSKTFIETMRKDLAKLIGNYDPKIQGILILITKSNES